MKYCILAYSVATIIHNKEKQRQNEITLEAKVLFCHHRGIWTICCKTTWSLFSRQAWEQRTIKVKTSSTEQRKNCFLAFYWMFIFQQWAAGRQEKKNNKYKSTFQLRHFNLHIRFIYYRKPLQGSTCGEGPKHRHGLTLYVCKSKWLTVFF